ncbi:glycosyltransferase family 4 protein [Candidatus Ruminimicrobiellum ovillum]|uniref:glycosyltransferase family 4 protein n=1 Tax=Candidatus Ruminimicrobiellum ovillum TaxID=1947927 RepID=UPI00355A1257
MKTIVYSISTLRKSGPVVVLYNIVKNLDLTKYKPIIITLSKEPQDTMIKDFQNLNIEIIQLNLNRIKGFLFGGFQLKKIIEKINPNVIHCSSFRDMLLVGFFIKKKYKKIATIHCDFPVEYILRYKFIVGKIMVVLQKYIIRKFNKRITVSELLSKKLNKKYSKINFDFIDNGIDTDYFKPIDNKTELRLKLNLPIDKKIFIWGASFIDVKSPITLIEVIKQIKNKNLFFVCCGARGNLFEICKEKLADYSNVLFTGYVNNMKEYLQASDYYITTSLSEGLPNGVLEALSCGLPCILSDISQHKYILEKTKDNGIFFKTQDVEDLKNKISEILNVEYNLYSKNAVNLIQNKFSAKLMSKKYQSLYIGTN